MGDTTIQSFPHPHSSNLPSTPCMARARNHQLHYLVFHFISPFFCQSEPTPCYNPLAIRRTSSTTDKRQADCIFHLIENYAVPKAHQLRTLSSSDQAVHPSYSWPSLWGLIQDRIYLVQWAYLENFIRIQFHSDDNSCALKPKTQKLNHHTAIMTVMYGTDKYCIRQTFRFEE